MSTNTILNLESRESSGKGGARKLRATGKVPCVLYGKGADTVTLTVGTRELLGAVAGHSVSNLILDLNLSGDEAKALIREIQIDPLTQEVLHVDFQRVSLTEMLEIEIPVELVGNPIGVREDGGILAHPARTVKVNCLPGDIPEKIEVDVSHLAIGSSVHVSDIRAQGLDIVSEDELLIASVSAPSVQVEETVEAEGEGVEGAAAEGEGAEGEATEGGDATTEGEKKDKK